MYDDLVLEFSKMANFITLLNFRASVNSLNDSTTDFLLLIKNLFQTKEAYK